MTTTHTITSVRSFLSALAVLLALSIAAPHAHADTAALSDAGLLELSRRASTPQEHARVAKQYRVRAEALEAQAARHEAAASANPATQPPIAHKFPSAFGTKAAEEKQNAVQARRAAQEARTLAHWHLSRAVETFFGQ